MLPTLHIKYSKLLKASLYKCLNYWIMETSVKNNYKRELIPNIKKTIPERINKLKKDFSLTKYMSIYLITFITICIVAIGFLIVHFK